MTACATFLETTVAYGPIAARRGDLCRALLRDGWSKKDADYQAYGLARPVDADPLTDAELDAFFADPLAFLNAQLAA